MSCSLPRGLLFFSLFACGCSGASEGDPNAVGSSAGNDANPSSGGASGAFGGSLNAAGAAGSTTGAGHGGTETAGGAAGGGSNQQAGGDSNVAGASGSGGGVEIPPTNVWTSIAPGQTHTCAIDSDGSLYCWGQGEGSMFGVNSLSQTLTPVHVGRDSDWLSVVSGDAFSCGLKKDSSLYCWGIFALGLASAHATFGVPTRLGTDNDWRSISSNSGGHACGLKTNGALYCWGQNFLGEFGDGTQTSSATPVLGSEHQFPTRRRHRDALVDTATHRLGQRLAQRSGGRWVHLRAEGRQRAVLLGISGPHWRR